MPKGSRGGKRTGGGFGGANNASEDHTKHLLPAEINLGNAKGSSVEKTIDKFRQKYGKANREYGVVVDREGYAIEHNKGNKHSVSFRSDIKGGTFIHNHPSGSHFSSTDLETFARTKASSIVAVSSNKERTGTYRIQKTEKFNSKGFVKAMSSARFDDSSMDSYNKGADRWLRNNAKKYGYKYTKSSK